MDLMQNMPYFLTGALSATAVVAVPAMTGLATTPAMKYGVQAAVAIGGGILVGQFAGKTHGSIWAITGGAVILAEVLKDFVFKPMGLLSDYEISDYEISDIGDEELEGYEESEGLEAFPEMEELQDSSLDAYPTR